MRAALARVDWTFLVMENLPLIMAVAIFLVLAVWLVWAAVYSSAFHAGRRVGHTQGYQQGRHDERTAAERDEPTSMCDFTVTLMDGTKRRLP